MVQCEDRLRLYASSVESASHIAVMMSVLRRPIRVVILSLAFALPLASGARAQVQTPSSCSCTCFDGRPQSICTNPAETSICTPDICPPKSLVLAPIQPMPVQQKVCTSQLVWNDKTNQYEMKEVCR